MAEITYLNKKILIIEDHTEMCELLNSMLIRLGAKEIDSAKTGEEGIELLSHKSYDIVLADYELGPGKDGQQVLEEARFSKLLKAQSIFILVTAAQTVEMVMGALEYHPDGYITKPVTFEELKTRLERILKNKLVFSDINEAIDNNEINNALVACSRLIIEQPRFSLPTYRIKGKLLLEAHRYDEAEELYETVLEIRKVAWAMLGMAKVLYFQGRYDEAKTLLERLARKNDKIVEAFDWLAKIHEAQGDTVNAQRVLQRALDLSPKALLRQQQLSKLAEANEDWAVATKAARKSVMLGKNSIYKSPQSYIRLVKALQTQIKASGSAGKLAASKEMFSTIDSLKKEFEVQEDVQVKAYLLEGSAYRTVGKEEEAERAVRQALQYYQDIKSEISTELALEMGTGMVENLDKEEALAFIQAEEQQELFSDEINELLQEKVVEIEQERTLTRIDTFNNRGVELFEKGSFRESIEMFDQAANHMTASLSVLLNTVQAYITFMQREGPDKYHLEKCSEYFDRLSVIKEDDKRFKRYLKLKGLLSELESQR